MNQCKWLNYNFHIYDLEIECWNDLPGIYIYSVWREHFWHPIYVGKTNSFKSRLPCHERLLDAQRHGVRHVHAMVVSDDIERDDIECKLIQHLQPPLNTQHKDIGINTAAIIQHGLLSSVPTGVPAKNLVSPSLGLGLLNIPSGYKPGGLLNASAGIYSLEQRKQ